MRSIHLNTEKGFRGGEVQTLGLVRHLASRHEDVTLLAPPNSELGKRAVEAGIEFVPFSPLGEWDLLAALRLGRIIRRSGARIFHAHTPHALALGLLARKGPGRPFVVGSRRVSFPVKAGSAILKYSKADSLVAVSRSIAESLESSGIDPGRIHVIHSGVDLGRFTSLPSKAEARNRWRLAPSAPIIGVVSALSHHKGVGIFMKALHGVWMEKPDVRAVVAGAGELLDPLRRAAEIQNLPVHFLGFLPEPAELLPALDVLVLPSLSGEGSPGAVKEAAAAGVPVVATDVGGTTEILRPNREAIIVSPGDPDDLSRGILRLLKNEPLANTIRAAAKERIQAFSMDAMAGATLEMYRKLLNGTADPTPFAASSP